MAKNNYKAKMRLLNKSFSGVGARLSISTDIPASGKRALNKAFKDAEALGKEEYNKIALEASAYASSRMAKLGREVKRRWRAKEIPNKDPFSGRSFRRRYKDRTGGLKGTTIQTKVIRKNRKTFNNGVEAEVLIKAASAALTQSKTDGKANYPYLKKFSHANPPFTPAGDPDDLFSMIEFGGGHMRYANQSYTTFSGEVYSKTQGYFILDRIIKDEHNKLRRTFNRDLTELIREKLQ